MNQDYPVPSPELVRRWREEAAHRQYSSAEVDEHIAEQAAHWGYQQCTDEIAAETESRWLDGKTD